MAAFGDRIQALLDEFYSEWQKEENKGKSKWDVLDGFSAAHQIAVVFGNFNYQVENGGINQWVYNGYFHDDAEKLIEHLEIGAESDERCRTILDKIYKLSQYAQETDCDRYGSFTDDEGETCFIGDMINSDAFDTWYYANCDEDNWWQVVSGIIDKVEEREPSYSPFNVFIANSRITNPMGDLDTMIELPITAAAFSEALKWTCQEKCSLKTPKNQRNR